MQKPIRKGAINGERLRYLRSKEQWSQRELADKIGVHRVTLARWESNEVEPPDEIAPVLTELFRVHPDFLLQVFPVGERESSENPTGEIHDSTLKRIPLAKLQKNTLPALKASGLTLRQLARRVRELSVDRLQELLQGQKPTAAEIQLLRSNLGSDFNPVSSLKKRILASSATEETLDDKLTIILRQVTDTAERLEMLYLCQRQLEKKVDRLLSLLPEEMNS